MGNTKGAVSATRSGFGVTQAKVTTLNEVSLEEVPRFSSTFKEFDRVLGGGVVPGSAILIGGSPGSGKEYLAIANPMPPGGGNESLIRHR